MAKVAEARIFVVQDTLGEYRAEARAITTAIAPLGIRKNELWLQDRFQAMRKLESGLSKNEKPNIALLGRDNWDEPMHELSELLKKTIIGIPILALFSNYPLKYMETYVEPARMPDSLIQAIQYWASVDFKGMGLLSE